MKTEIDWQSFLGQHDMTWVVKPVSWNEGAMIGNGSIGAMVYCEENKKKRHVVRFVMGRTDVTASHRGAYSPRVPIGELDLELAGSIYHPTELRIDLWNAELRAVLSTTMGTVRLRAFVHAEEPVLMAEIETTEGERTAAFRWYSYPDVDPVLKNTDGINMNQYIPEMSVERSETDGISCEVQKYSKSETEGCTAAWLETEEAPGRKTFCLTLLKGADDNIGVQATDIIRRTASQPFEEWVDSHRNWWHAYYPQSFVSIPDTRLEGFYWIQMYKLASATRRDAMIIDNQGPWLTSTPWAGVWFNMNVQMSYSPVYASNRLELGESLIKGLRDHTDQLIRNVREEWQVDSAGLGRSCSYDLNSQVQTETGNLTWILHNCWRQYRYSMNEELLKDFLYPLLRRSVNFYLHLLEEGEDGKLHLPPTISPEYGSFFQQTVADCHYDLALLRWGCMTLLEINESLKANDPLRERWMSVLERLVSFPQNEDGYMIGRDTPLDYGHRHFSHLQAAFPLHIVDTDKSENHELVRKTLRHWIGKEGDLRGFTFTGAASVAATLGYGNEALSYLQAVLHMFTPNTMYKEAGPVIETPLAAAESIHDLLLQSWGGIIRIFPAVPDEWEDVVFHDLRAEGAFLVSAERKQGKTAFVRIRSLVGGSCLLRSPWESGIIQSVQSSAGMADQIMMKDADGLLHLDMQPGEEVVLFPEGTDSGMEWTIQPLEPQRNLRNYFGGPKAWRQYGIPWND